MSCETHGTTFNKDGCSKNNPSKIDSRFKERVNNHNLPTLAALQSVLKPIEEADESEQD